jgi:flavin-dependent dehydrogenase
MNYDVIIVGAGPGGIFSAYELAKEAPHLKVAVFEAGQVPIMDPDTLDTID